MRSVKTIGKFLPSLKDSVEYHEKGNLIYKIPSACCDYVYFGQTKRDVKSCVAEHKRTIKFQRSEKLTLCEHRIEFNRKIDWSGSTILKYESN